MLVPAPGLFSITTCWPQILDSRSVVMRATVSLDPPGAYGTTTRTGRVGQAWANVGRLTAGASANVAARTTRRRRSMTIAVFNRHSPDEQSLRRSVDLVNTSSFPVLRKDGPLGSPSSNLDLMLVEAFRQGLRDAGLIEKRHIELDVVWVANESEYRQALIELIRRGAKILVTAGS